MASVYQAFRNRHYRLLRLENPQPLFELLHSSIDQPWKSDWNKIQFQLIPGPREQELSYGELSFLIPSIPLLHERTMDQLAPFLTPFGELLPILSENGVYYAYHVLRAYDALDTEQSVAYLFPEKPQQIHQYVFYQDKVLHPLFFRLPQSAAPFFATQSFIQKLDEHNFQGWQFEKCWESEHS